MLLLVGSGGGGGGGGGGTGTVLNFFGWFRTTDMLDCETQPAAKGRVTSLSIKSFMAHERERKTVCIKQKI